MFNKKIIIKTNKKFDRGKIVNENSLEFALSSARHTKDWLKQLAYLTRAIVLDHVFEEGNKRTAAALIMGTMEVQKSAYDPYKVDKVIIEMIRKNIADINKIRRMIKDATR